MTETYINYIYMRLEWEERKMEKKRSGSSRPGTLTSVKAEDIFSKPLTKRERETVRRTAERQASGDDSHIDYSDIPPLTDEQLAATRDFGMRAEVGLEFVDVGYACGHFRPAARPVSASTALTFSLDSRRL